MGFFKRLMDSIRGKGSENQGFELSDDVKREILDGMGMKPTDDLGFSRGEVDKKPKEEKSDH